MGQSLSVLGPGRLLVRCPPLPPRPVSLHEGAWRETAAALRLDAPGVVALLLPLRDGRFRLRVELGCEPLPEADLGLPDAWVLVDGPARSWVRRKASEAAIILEDEAAARRRRVRELTGELCLIDVIAGRRPPRERRRAA
jgi:hypothetical protein